MCNKQLQGAGHFTSMITYYYSLYDRAVNVAATAAKLNHVKRQGNLVCSNV